jgi:hypothetical protein
MLGRHSTCFRSAAGLGEGNRATRGARLRRNRACQRQHAASHRSSSGRERLTRYIAILTLATTPAAVVVLPGIAAASPNEPAATRAPEGAHDHASRAVGRPPTSGGGSTTTWTLPTCGHMPPTMHVKLNASFRLAVRSVREVPACRALFQSLGTSGEERLSRTVYERADLWGIDVCVRRHATALTRVGISTTWVCPAFDQLVSVDGALTLIHEALHFAGLPEYPGTPGAPTAAQIQQMVRTRCDPTRVR